MSRSNDRPRRLSRGAYIIGWVCVLEVEQIAALEMFDEEHEPLPQPAKDQNVYKLGSINGHNIVLTRLHQRGNCSAAMAVTFMRSTFPNMTYGLLVGIGGGVPGKDDRDMIRLGHVVVSKPSGTHPGVIQYDYGRATRGHFERISFLSPPPTILLNAANSMAVDMARRSIDPIQVNIGRIRTGIASLRHFSCPGVAKDYLYRPEYIHKEPRKPCDEAGCDFSQRIERMQLNGPFVVVHRGTIASGELVVKDATLRDELARRDKVICFEMEAAGVLIDFPCLVVRGIADYCDSHKSNLWHGFAAAAAAAYGRELFFHVPRTKGNPRPPYLEPDLMLGIEDYASYLRAWYRFDEADELCSRAWELRRQTLGNEHPDTIRCLAQIAAILFEQQKFARAKERGIEVLELQHRVLGCRHQETLRTYELLVKIEESLLLVQIEESPPQAVRPQQSAMGYHMQSRLREKSMRPQALLDDENERLFFTRRR